MNSILWANVIGSPADLTMSVASTEVITQLLHAARSPEAGQTGKMGEHQEPYLRERNAVQSQLMLLAHCQ